MNDIELMLNNSRIFNGLNSPLTKKAEAIQKTIASLLELDRTTLGMDHCPLNYLEDCIRKKFLHLGRELPNWVPVVKYVPKPTVGVKVASAPSVPNVPAPVVIPEYIGVPAAPVPAWVLAKQASSSNLASPRAGAPAASHVSISAAAAAAAAAATTSAPTATAATAADALAVTAQQVLSAAASPLSRSMSASASFADIRAAAGGGDGGMNVEDGEGQLPMEEEDAGDPIDIVTEFF